MNGKFIIALVAVWSTIGSADAQTSFYEYRQNYQAEFGKYRSEQERQFKQYRDSLNARYAEYMRLSWVKTKMNEPKPVPATPEPPRPVVKAPDLAPSSDRLPHSVIVPFSKPTPAPQPVVPLPKPEVKPKAGFTFTFYGAKCELPLEAPHRFRLAGTAESDVADGWEKLSADKYLPVISACLDYRDKLRLNDWGYALFTRQLTSAFFPPSQLNEARLMQMYILVHSGYKARLGRAGNRLVVLLPSENEIFQYSYLLLGGSQYYQTDKSIESGPVHVFDREFPNEQEFSLQIKALPNLPLAETAPRHLQSTHDRAMSADVSVNRRLIDFFNDYPLSNDWDVYSMASMSGHAAEKLYPALKAQIAGKDAPTAANMLLHFVQTVFEYATDKQQFGSERPLFADETLFYPYCDCEDRAILYSILVRELLGLDVVLVHYPGHMATGVRFDTDVSGDYVSIDGRRYLVCDPTFINADIGQSMPQYKQTAAEIIRTR